MSATGIISTVNTSIDERVSCFDRKVVEEEGHPLVKELWMIVAMTVIKDLFKGHINRKKQ